MKYQKNFEKVSFGFGNEKTAGKGRLSETVDENNRVFDDKTAIITIAVQALIAVGAVIFKCKFGKKKDKKKAKKKSKKKK